MCLPPAAGVRSTLPTLAVLEEGVSDGCPQHQNSCSTQGRGRLHGSEFIAFVDFGAVYGSNLNFTTSLRSFFLFYVVTLLEHCALSYPLPIYSMDIYP